MKTMSTSIRSPHRVLYVGLALTLSASVALQGAALWQTLHPVMPIAGGAAAAIAGGGLLCLLGAVLLLIPLLRRRQQSIADARGLLGLPRPRSPEQAAALAHSQKMEALGLLAGGVAHDFNNLLHVIRNSLEILQRPGTQTDARRSLEMIRRSADQAAALTGQLLACSRRRPLEARPVDPNDLVSRMTELLRHSLGERITIETVLGRGVGNVAADAGQLETALLNLAVNARDAMSQAGRLTIETANAVLDEQYVIIAVSDTGAGMPPEVAARACEPFFTTKEPGHGTGLGLSQVAGFARQSGGHVRIASEPGRGTTVRLYLPKIARPAERQLGRPLGTVSSGRPVKEPPSGMPLAVGAGPER